MFVLLKKEIYLLFIIYITIYLKYFNPQPSLILFTGEKRRKSEGDKVQKFNAEKEVFLK